MIAQMEIILMLIIAVSLFLFIIIYFNGKFNNIANNQKPSLEIMQIINLLQNRSKEDRDVLMQTLQKNNSDFNSRLDNATKVISDVQKNLGEMSEIGRSMKDLQDFLKSPKIRGNIGEQVLKELLLQMLPQQSFSLQYSFKTGDKVDAAIFTSAGIIPVDSKFPMENFQKMSLENNVKNKETYQKEFGKDVKKHIDAISKKYILPEEGTIDYAIMYIPSEAIYYEIINNISLYKYASQNSVMPVSPSTFYAFLKVVLMSFEGQKVEAKAKEILNSLKSIQKDYQKVEENLNTLGKHVNNANNMMNTTFNSFSKLGQKIEFTKSLEEKTKKNELLS